MTVELDALVVTMRAESGRFRDDIATVYSALGELEAMATLPQKGLDALKGPLADTNDLIDRSVRDTFSGLEDVLVRFAETGSLSFESLRATARSVLGEIAQSALHSIFSGGSSSSGGFLGSLLGNLSFIGGRATGGPVSPARPYIVGEQGPELFVPQGAGQIIPSHKDGASGGRPISITVNVNGKSENGDLRQSATQIALSVRRALAQAQRFD